MEQADWIIWPRWIVPVVPAGEALTRQGVVIRDGAIVAILPADGVTRFEAEREVHLPNHVLLPGLVNSHTHLAMSLMRGVGDDMDLMPWLETRIWPIEGRHVSETFVTDGVRLAIAEMIRGGTTCANDMYFFPEQAVEVAEDIGFRISAGAPIIEFPSAWAADAEGYLARSGKFLEAIAGSRLATGAVAPHAPYTVADDTFERAARLAERADCIVHLHLHETRDEVDRAVAETGIRPLERIRRLGLFGPRLAAVHMTELTDEEIGLCAEAGVHVVHCPESNLKLASGFCPVAKLLDAGVNVALGTDGAASNNDLDMFGEMRTAALLAKGVAGNPTVVSAVKALEMATINGARALGLDDRIGSIEPGKAADLVAVDLSGVETQPIYEVISHLVYATNRHQVSDVWLDGRRLLRDGELQGIDSAAIVAAAEDWKRRIIAGLEEDHAVG